MRDTIFRQEVIDEQSNRLFGGVLIRPPWQVSFIVYLLLLLFVTATLFLAFGTYHRKERAAGILRPNAGLVKVYPPRSGLIESISVAEGDRVNAGQILFIMGEDRLVVKTFLPCRNPSLKLSSSSCSRGRKVFPPSANGKSLSFERISLGCCSASTACDSSSR